MDQFLLIFRDDLITKVLHPLPDQLPDTTQLWKCWFRQMVIQNQLGWVLVCPKENTEDTIKKSGPEQPLL